MGESRAWLIRGGAKGQREERALGEGLAIVGWPELGDLSGVATRDELAAAVQHAYPDTARNVLATWTGQLWRFTSEVSEGDLVVMPLKNHWGFLAVGRVAGPYEYRAGEPEDFRQVRAVRWVRTNIPREAVRADLRMSLGSLLAVCELRRHDAARRVAHLAEHGTDPGHDAEGEITSAEELLDDAASRDSNNLRTLTIRALLEHWDARRRTSAVVAAIKADLAERGLTTRPPFSDGPVGDEIAIVPLATEPNVVHLAMLGGPDTEDVSEPPAMTMRLGALPNRLSSVPSTETLMKAMTLMLRHGCEVIGVIDEDGTYHGVVTWASIGKAHISAVEPTLAQATESAHVVDHDAPLADELDRVRDLGFVLVRDADRSGITGILTRTDLNAYLVVYNRPFILIEEAENRLRRAADETFGVDDLRAAVGGRWAARVHRAADLTFGAYVHLLRDPDRWARLDWKIDHGEFCDLLEAVLRMRNDLMHFARDPPSDDQYAAVQGLLTLLRTVDPRP